MVKTKKEPVSHQKYCVSNRRHFGSKCRTRHLPCVIRDQPRENRGHENHRDRYTVKHLVLSIICD